MRIFFIAIILVSSAVKAQPLVDTKYVYYSVSSPSKHELLDRLNKATPANKEGNSFHGYTDSYIKWNFWWETTSNYCRITKVKVTVDITFTLPKLSNSPEQVHDVWELWFPQLLLHENGHKNNAIDVARSIENGISQLPTNTSCKELEKKANKLGKDLIRKLSQMDKSYDRRTNHGETQGAWLYSYL